MGNQPSSVNFSVDAGIINRLGKELVGRAETAVSELIKNAYDADASHVSVEFIDTDTTGGNLIIKDNGSGMSRKQLINGFMRLSSSDKLHNPMSPSGRIRAGRKGIGRFATQRIGEKLRIKTKPQNKVQGLVLDIDWNEYQVDINLESIQNPISEISVSFEHGTELIISGLREAWTDPQIRRVFRYVSDLLQPSFLSDRSKKLSKGKSEGFSVDFFKTDNGNKNVIADLDRMIFDHALGVIEGYVINGEGICEVKSDRFGVDDQIDLKDDYNLIEDVHFKVYYFIYEYNYYEGFLPKMEYKRITDLANENSGIKLYRNGFRVPPYGDKGNDWVNIDKTSLKTEGGRGNVPFSNKHFFGFVELIDSDGLLFNETSSREGLIENDAFGQLIDFVNRSLIASTRRINSARFKLKNEAQEGSENPSSEDTTFNDKKSTREKLEGLKNEDPDRNSIIEEAIQKLEEVEMVRVLAGIGLSIAEFTHEIRQFIPSFNGSISSLLAQNLNLSAKESLINLKENFNRFKSYTAYIDHTITQNVHREKQPIDIIRAINEFLEIVDKDAKGAEIKLETDFYGYDLLTSPMHPSEWTSILYNLYTNSKKAIKRQEPNNGRIKIIAGRESGLIYIEFLDNGDGVPQSNIDRIFDPFFTTSTPASFDAPKNETAIGTGLGLKIVRDIVKSYQGRVFLEAPEQGYSTNFRVEFKEASQEELEKYGY